MKTQHILSLALWVAASLATATDIPAAPARIEQDRTAAFDWKNYSALRDACDKADAAQVRKLVAEGADINMALFCACCAQGRCTGMIQELLAMGADVNKPAVRYCTPLYAAIGYKRQGECEGWASRSVSSSAYEGQAELVKLLLQAGADPNACSTLDRVPPIIEAARTGDTATIELLLNAGANVNGREKSGNSALHWAVANHHNHVVELLLQRGAHPAIPSISQDHFDAAGVRDNMPGTTPLHCAAKFGNAKAAELLIQHGADIHAEDSAEATPFICSAESASVEVLKLLHKNGANICNPAVIYSLSLYKESLIDYLQYLAKAGFPFEQTNIFTIACHHTKGKEILTLLKEHGYKVPAANEMGESELYFLMLYANRHAKQEDIIAVIDLLVDCGADVPAMGFLALSDCVDNGYDRVFFRLLELGAPLTSPHPKQKRLLTARASYPRSVEGRQRIMQWLEQHHPDLVAAEQAELERRETAEARSKLNKQLIQEAQRGNISAVQELLAKGADLNYTDNFNNTALSATYGMSPNLQMTEFLLQQGANPNHYPIINKTDKHPLSRCHNTDQLRLLVKHGANLNKADSAGHLFLHSIAGVNSSLVHCALELGANPTLTDAAGRSALMMARTTDAALMLLQAAPQMLHHTDCEGNTALHHVAAASFCNFDNGVSDFSHLPTRNTRAKINTNITGEVNELELFHLCISAGLSPDSQNKQGQTPLMIAAAKGNLRLVTFLLKMGADATICDHSGRSALGYALISGHPDIIIRLKQHQAPGGKEAQLLQAVAAGHTAEVEQYIQNGMPVTGADSIGHTAALVAALNGQEEMLKLLLNHGVKIDACNTCERRLLNIAVAHNNEEAVRLLIKHGANIHMQGRLHQSLNPNCRYGTALHEAAAHGHAEMVKLLHNFGCSLNAYRSPLVSAIYSNNPQTVRTLVELGADIHGLKQDSVSLYPLCVAADAENADMVRLLLELGANPNGKSKHPSSSPLFFAMQRHNAELVRILLEAGADADATDSYKQNHLHSAVCDQTPEVVALFIKHGANVNLQSKVSGRLTTPLINAVRYRNAECPEIIEMLLQAGADPNVRDAAGKTALDYAQEKGYSATLQLIKAAREEALIQAARNNNLPQLKKLLEAGVNPDCTTMPDIETPLFNAIGEKHFAECDGTPLCTDYREGQADMVKVLLEAGADPNLPSTMSHTPLMEAARTGDIISAKLLLQHGAVLNSRSCTGATALHFAAAEGTDAMVKLLLDAGAAPNLPTEAEAFMAHDSTNKGATPLHLAAQYGKNESIKLLLQAGVYVDTPDFYGNTPYFYAVKAQHESCIRTLIDAGANPEHKNTFESTAEDANL